MLLLLLLRKHRLSFVTSMTRHFSQIYRVPHKAACLSLPHSQYERNKVSYTIILPQFFFFFFLAKQVPGLQWWAGAAMATRKGTIACCKQAVTSHQASL